MQVSFFAAMRQIVGGRDFDVSLPADATALAEGDCVALIPPAAGG